MTDVPASCPGQAQAIEELARKFGQMTTDKTRTKRQAIAELARRYGVTTKEAYRAIEDAKKFWCLTKRSAVLVSFGQVFRAEWWLKVPSTQRP